MERGESGVPADNTASPVMIAGSLVDFEPVVVVGKNAETESRACETTTTSMAVGDRDVSGSLQMAGYEFVTDSLCEGWTEDPLNNGQSNAEDNVGTLPVDSHANGVLEPGYEEQQKSGCLLHPTDGAEPLSAGCIEDDVDCFLAVSPLRWTDTGADVQIPFGNGAGVCSEVHSEDDDPRSHKELAVSPLRTDTGADIQNPFGNGAGVCYEGHFNDDDPRSHKELASSADSDCGLQIGSLESDSHTSLSEGRIQNMQGDQNNSVAETYIPSETSENLYGTRDSVTPRHPDPTIEGTTEVAPECVADTFLADCFESQSEGPVQGTDAIVAGQINGSSSDHSVEHTGIDDTGVHSAGCDLEVSVKTEKKLDGVLLIHTGDDALQVSNSACTLPQQGEDHSQMADKEGNLNDSFPKTELSNSCQESPSLARTGDNASQDEKDHDFLCVTHEESRNDSSVKVEASNSCQAQELLATQPSCSHVEEPSSSHLHQGPVAPGSCHFTKNPATGNIVLKYNDTCKYGGGGTHCSDLLLLRDESCFHSQEEPSATHLQHPSIPTDSCLLLEVMTPPLGLGGDDSGKSTQTSCSSPADCQTELHDLPENGANNSAAVDPTSATIRRNPRRAAQLKCVSTPVKPTTTQTTPTAKKVSKPGKTKNKKTPVCRSLITVSFGNVTKKRTFRNVVHSSRWGNDATLYRMFENRSSFSRLPSELGCAASMSMLQRKCNGKKRSNTKKPGKGPRTSVAYPCSLAQFSSRSMYLDTRANSSAGDAHIGDKDLDSSVTLETQPNENYTSDYPVNSFQIGPSSLAEFTGDVHQTYADTSPESEVIHPANDIDPAAINGAMYTNHKACSAAGIGGQNECFLDSHLQNNLDFATYAAPRVSTPYSHLCSNNNMEGKLNGDIQGHALESIQGPLRERSVSDFGWERDARSAPDNQTGASSSKCYKRKTKRKPKKEAHGQELLAEPQSSKPIGNRFCGETLEAQTCRQYHSVTVDHDEKNIGAIFAKAKTSKCRPKLKDITRSKENDSFRRNKKILNSSSKKKKNKDKNLCPLGPGIGHHEVDSQTRDTHEDPSTVSACLSETDESKKMMHLNNLHTSQCVENAVNLLDCGKMSSERTTLIDNEQALQSVGSLEERQCWVRCDDCLKWRFIPTAIADSLGEDCKWTCKDNVDKNFADCGVPQAKTDGEINAELGISDEEEYNTAKPPFRLSAPTVAKPQAPWTLIRSNLFLHRSRKKQNIDEVMLCQCRPPKDGSLGCGDTCLNRILNIECVRGTCPCGDLCSNQLFQRRKYAKLKWFRCGKKGYGLQVQQNVPRGKFLIEYIGEVLDMAAYEARQREYASRGQRHFYFMTLNGSEVIDACYKGNLGRFINHSCNPNCRTEKWIVNGEVCIGLFAIRDIKKGEEVTFDYNYVRVFGAAAKKCFCGSSDCRGYIGGDPLNPENIVQGDSDDEFPEPVMVKDSEIRSVMEVGRRDVINMESTRFGGRIEDTEMAVASLQSGDECLQSVETDDKLLPVPPTETTYSSLSDEKTHSNAPAAATHVDDIHPISETIPTSLPLSHELDVAVPVAETVSGSASETYKVVGDEYNKQPIATVDKEEHAKPNVSVKSCAHSVLAKNNRSGANRISAKKGKKMAIGGHSCHFEAVDDKLNQLLDDIGGISKHKLESAKSYLKLLVVTVTSRDNSGSEAIQSTRDMSLILDALLKTKSRTVLMDIIESNGLQMLHNILKQSRKDTNKVPILRKLLKVFDHFALRKVLTVDHIDMIPSNEGVESFRDSIISLTGHADTKVKEIAGKFQYWISDSTWKAERSGRSKLKQDLHDTSSFRALLPSKLHDAKSDLPPVKQESCKRSPLATENADGPRRRRRRTRWDRDEPAFVEIEDPQSSVSHRDHDVAAAFVKTRLGSSSDLKDLNIKHGSRRDRRHFDRNSSNSKDSNKWDVDEIPPGFDSPSLRLHASKNPECRVHIPYSQGDVVAGIIQERYLPHLAISHGIPIQLVEQLGTPANGGSSPFPSWGVAPGMPFQPFPPLPPYPRKKSRPNHQPRSECTGVSQSHHHSIASGCTEVSSSPSEPSLPSTSGQISHQSRNNSSFDSRRVKRGSPPMDVRNSFRHKRRRDQRSNEYKTAWPRKRDSYSYHAMATKRCRTETTSNGNILEKYGDGRDAGDLDYALQPKGNL